MPWYDGRGGMVDRFNAWYDGLREPWRLLLGLALAAVGLGLMAAGGLAARCAGALLVVALVLARMSNRMSNLNRRR